MTCNGDGGSFQRGKIAEAWFWYDGYDPGAHTTSSSRSSSAQNTPRTDARCSNMTTAARTGGVLRTAATGLKPTPRMVIGGAEPR